MEPMSSKFHLVPEHPMVDFIHYLLVVKQIWISLFTLFLDLLYARVDSLKTVQILTDIHVIAFINDG